MRFFKVIFLTTIFALASCASYPPAETVQKSSFKQCGNLSGPAKFKCSADNCEQCEKLANTVPLVTQYGKDRINSKQVELLFKVCRVDVDNGKEFDCFVFKQVVDDDSLFEIISSNITQIGITAGLAGAIGYGIGVKALVTFLL